MSANDQTKLAVIATDISYMKEKLTRIDSQLLGNFVTKEEFEPIKKIVYGLVGLILVGVVGAILALILRQ